MGSGFDVVAEVGDDGQEVDIALELVLFEMFGVVVEAEFKKAASDIVGKNEGSRHASIIISDN